LKGGRELVKKYGLFDLVVQPSFGRDEAKVGRANIGYELSGRVVILQIEETLKCQVLSYIVITSVFFLQ
jgi:hypothetical protein